MSVDYYVCTACNETYADCSSRATSCHEDHGGCRKQYCSDDCAELQTAAGDSFPPWAERWRLPPDEREALVCTCVDCRGELASDENLLKFLLTDKGWTRKQAAQMYLTAKKAEREAAKASVVDDSA